MKYLFSMLFILLIGITSTAADKSYIGHWKAECEAMPPTKSKICYYEFNENNKGAFSCEHFSNLKCMGKGDKNIEPAKSITHEALSTEKQGLILRIVNGKKGTPGYLEFKMKASVESGLLKTKILEIILPTGETIKSTAPITTYTRIN